MSLTYCVTSVCPIRNECQRFENDAGSHCVFRTYADFSEELVRRADNTVSCPFFKDKGDTVQANAA